MKKVFVILYLIFQNSYLALGQCAMCKGSVQSNMSTGRDVIANGINGGIAYLFAFPYLTVAIIGYLWYRNSKKILAEKQLLRERVRKAYQ